MITRTELYQQWQRLQISDMSAQQRGYQLEKLIYDLLKFEGLKPAPAYKFRESRLMVYYKCKRYAKEEEVKWSKNSCGLERYTGVI